MSKIIDFKKNTNNNSTNKKNYFNWFKSKWYIFGGILVAIIVIVLSFILNIFNPSFQPETIKAAWFNDSWHYRQQFDVFNASTTEELINFQAKIATSTLTLQTLFDNNKVKSDLSDLRFTDIDGNLLDYWHPDATSTMRAVYVKFPSLPKNATSTLFMYYNNPSAEDVRNGNEVFDFFDDFGEPQLNRSKWPTMAATPSVSGGELVLADGAAAEGVISQSTYLKDIVLEIRAKQDNTDLDQGYLGFSNTSSLGTGFTADDAAFINLDSTTGGSWEVGTANEGTTSAGTSATEDASYHDFTIAWAADAVFQVDDSSSATISTNEPDENSYLRLENSSNTRTLTVDWVIVRKYVASDPSIVATAGTSEEVGGGPMAYWSFDEGYGTTAYDLSGNGYNGALTNMSTTGTSTAWIVGKVNKALRFDGIDDYINVGNTSLFTNTSYSISLWAKWENNSLCSSINHCRALAGTTSAGGNGFRLGMEDSPAGRFEFLSVFTEGSISLTYALSASEWQKWNHYVVTVNLETGVADLYINGINRASDSADVVADPTGISSFLFGGAGGDRQWDGSLDEVKIYNYALTPERIITEFNQALNASFGLQNDQTNGLVAWYKMDESTTAWDGAGDRVNDYSGLDNTGTASGNALATAGKYGNGGEFDGTGDYVSVADSASLDLNQQATLEAWINPDSITGSHYLIDKDQTTAYSLLTSGSSMTAYFANSSCSGGTITINAWAHLSASFDGQYIRCYLNGEEVGKTSYKGTIGVNTATLYLGSDNGATGDFDGTLDDIKIYNLARTPDQIMNDYLQGPDPIAYYDFEEGSGTTLYDKSGQGHNGAITAGASQGFVQGQYGRAYDFDGVDSIINFNTDFDIGTSDFSVNIWEKHLSTLTTNNVIINTGFSGAGTWLVLLRPTTNYMDFLLYNGVTVKHGTDCGIAVPGKWNMLTWTFDRDGLAHMYVNGVDCGTATDISSYSGEDLNYLDTATIGGSFNGTLDEVRVYDSVLTPWQIAQEYNGGKPMAHWSFDEGYGTAVYNNSGNGYNGALTNMSTSGTSTAWVVGKVGQALKFDGNNDTVSVTDTAASALDVRSQATVSAWIKPATVSGSQYIIDKDQATAYSLMLNGSTLYGYFDIGGSNSCSGGKVKANEWTHVSAVYDGSTIKCYVNGKEVGRTADSGTIDSQNTALYIGSDGGAANYFKGLIDEIKIYHYPLSPADLRTDYNEGLAAVLSQTSANVNQNQQGLIAWYKMDESTTAWDGAGDRVNDYSGLDNTGTASGNALATAGKYGNGGEFDGTGDYVSISDSNSLDLNQQATLEAWINPDSLTGSHYLIDKDQTTAYSLLTSGSSMTAYFANSSCSGGTITINAWAHLSASFDGQYIRCYLNGEEVGKTSYKGTIGVNTATLYLGSDNGATSDFDGTLDDIKIYNLARTPDQIMNDYLQGPDPIAYYDFEEGKGTVANDKSGQGHNGTITAGASQGFVQGQYGRAYDFDGVDTKINLGRTVFNLKDNLNIPSWTSVGNPDTFEVTDGELHIADDENVNSIAYYTTGIPITAGNKYYYEIEAYGDSTGRLKSVVFSDNTYNQANAILPGAMISNTNDWATIQTKFGIVTATATGTVYPMLFLNNQASSRFIYATKMYLSEYNDIVGTGDITVSAWIYYKGAGEGARHVIIDDGGINSSTAGFYLSYRQSNETFRISSAGVDNETVVAYPSASLLNQWRHLVLTRTSAGVVNLYIDGVQIGGPLTTGTPVIGTTNVIIGNTNTQNATWNGKIDDLKIYDYVFTPYQTVEEYNPGQPAGYWKLDEGEGGTIYDWSGAGHHGSLFLNGSPATSTAWQALADCKLVRCLSFDGTDDYVDIGSTGIPVYSIGLWFKADDITAHTDYLIDLNGTDYLTVVNGTVTVNGFAGATVNVYVDGLKGNAVIPDIAGWHHIVVTATTGQTAGDLDIGRLDNSYADGTIDEVKIFSHTLSPSQVRNEYNLGFGTYFKNKWQCGDYFVDRRDNQSYNTVLVGAQCWMAQNLNVGTQINSPAAASVSAACTGHIGETLSIDGTSCYCETNTYASCQRSGEGGTTQKYCYNNTESYCSSEGALYEWQEAMDLDGSCAHSSCTPASGNRGICPVGWHIPTDEEIKTLEMNQGMSQAQADTTGWRGTIEGDKLKVADKCFGGVSCNSSGFSGLLAGYRNVTGAFSNRSSYAFFWSSSQNSATNAWYRSLYVSYSTVYRSTNLKYYGFSVRCIKD